MESCIIWSISPPRIIRWRIIAVDEERIKIRLIGVTEDVNYYDGSKPKSTMQLIAWLDKEA